jgi:thymidylate synthase
MMIQHDMSLGFPLITTKKMGIKSISAELEFFIKGLSDKQWLKDRKCNIWNEWCNPSKIPNGLNENEIKDFQFNENDLGKVYGYQWRNFNSSDYDQLQYIINTIKKDPNDRRLICSAWNPLEFSEMALPPCHLLWNVQIIGNKLNLCWYQRSVDTFLGLPYNIASYAILLKLLCKECGYEEGTLTGFLADVHIYENHVEQVKEQLSRTTFDLPQLNIINFDSILNWEYINVELINYVSHPSIKAEIAI